jgi:hypothetical protein
MNANTVCNCSVVVGEDSFKLCALINRFGAVKARNIIIATTIQKIDIFNLKSYATYVCSDDHCHSTIDSISCHATVIGSKVGN